MQAKKSLGQHFLKNPRVADRVADAAHVSKEDTTLEIGPGKGMLTEVLLKQAGKVVAVEKDPELIPVLQNTFSTELSDGQLVLIPGDILDPAIQEKVFQNLHLPYKIAANIPYFITGKLIRLFFSFPQKPESIGLLVQNEVALRAVGKGGKESILSMSIKAYGTPRYVGKVSAGNFSPPPKVDSAILGIENISEEFFDGFTEEEFFEVVKAGFAHKRKRLQKNLEDLLPQYLFSFDHLSPNIRAEDMSLEDWKTLLSGKRRT
ncbi:MAG TPA: 16S rRNA (adenine(1518)-N(6)/adenine(1519)-N(6))-dimethyltransferase RsmA [Candidatus Paceibacterota bacterium]|nr:16S rRNA (adenine(1518)-N(6)/adenine(1519)-N(6))-dimethyltransferase RsmA [Candidatus Paceibacterota bacterium]